MKITLSYDIFFIKSCLEERVISDRMILHCNGNEEHLFNCSFTHHDCWSGEDASVNCTVAECTEGAVRLVGGMNKTEGQVEICLNGGWHRLCDSSSSWTYKGAQVPQVVCKQLGYPYSGISMIVFKPLLCAYV